MSKEVCQVFLTCSVNRGIIKFEGAYYAPGVDAHSSDYEQLINNTILQFLSSRELSKTCPKTGGDFGQFGNAAKLREALQKAEESAAEIMERVRHKDGLAFNTANYIASIAKDALAATEKEGDAK